MISTIGFSVFLYGKRQQHPACLIAGVALMVCPYVVPGALGMTAVAVGIIAALNFVTKRG